MKICGRKINAIIFDLDGTLLDSSGIWGDIDKEFFAKRNMEIPSTFTEEIVHIGLDEAAVLTAQKYCKDEKPEDILYEWKQASRKHYEKLIQLKPYALELLEILKKNNVKLAVATANKRYLYEPCLKRLNVYDYFDFIADVDIVGEGKNSVKLYNYVADRLNEKPSNIAVFEDIYIGLKTAFENGYFSIAVYDHHDKDENLKKKYSHVYINDFKEIIEKMD